MRYLLSLVSLLILGSVSAQSKFIPAYESTLKGGNLSYHGPQPDVKNALVVRSESVEDYIEWETAVIPHNHKGKFVDLRLMMAMDVNPEDPHQWTFGVNGKDLFNITTPIDTSTKTITISGESKAEFNFTATQVDGYGDLVGYVRLRIPTAFIEKGKAARIRIQGESAASRTWLIVYKYKMQTSAKVKTESAIRRGEQGNYRRVKLELAHYKEGAKVEFHVGEYLTRQELSYGFNRIYVNIPIGDTVSAYSYKVMIEKETIDKGRISLPPIKPISIYLLHHSHVDIGYTHVQKEVEEKQWRYIDECLDLIEASDSYSEGHQFKWNLEVMWALHSYMQTASPEQQLRLQEAVRKGKIELGALYGNHLTGLSTSEELMYLMKPARKVAQQFDVELSSAMISDVPGWNWGLIPALSQSGVRYLSLGTNPFHRIGYTIEEWGDKPFYWQSASGKEKVLAWIHGAGYASFHTGQEGGDFGDTLDDEVILSYLNALNSKNYPYNKVVLRYNIGADNGPPDVMLSEKVKAWNKEYVSPQLIISTTTEAFEIFEQEYGADLPIVTGDFTGYWEDGAASSAKETAQNRYAAHRTTQAQTLLSMNNVGLIEDQLFEVWRDILLYNEHTWGSWNSISEPHSDFTKQQWATKQSFALNGVQNANTLVDLALKNRMEEASPFYEVINTHSWAVKDVVSISAAQTGDFNAVENEKGVRMKSQKLKDGSLIFLTDEITGFSSRKYKLIKAEVKILVPETNSQNSLETDKYKIVVDGTTGVVKELFWKPQGVDLVSNVKHSGLNEYIYVEGREAKNRFKATVASVKVEENGEVMSSVRVTYNQIKACKKASVLYKLYHGLDRIDIVNELDKEAIYEQEGVHFAFPFNIPNGTLRYDLAYGVCRAEEDQIKGSNKNFISIENWVDISNDNYGITWICKDAPLIEVGGIYNDPIVEGYLKTLSATQTFLSYVMNNYWETNYQAAQSGNIRFNYSFYGHDGYNSASSEKRALEIQEPLLVIPVAEKTICLQLPLSLKNNSLIIQSVTPIAEEDNGRYLVRVFNAGSEAETLNWSTKPTEIYLSDPDGKNLQKLSEEISLKPMELVNLVVKR